MNDVGKLLEYVQRTNRDMTIERLLEELGKSRYSSIALAMVAENVRQEK